MRKQELFFLKDPSLFADAPVEGAAGGAPAAKVPTWVNVLPEPDQDGLIFSRDNRVLHIDDMAKLATRSNKALKKQRGGGLVDKDHETYGGFFMSGGGPAIAWAEEFEWRPGKGMWALTEWLPEGEQLVASRQYRYTSSVVTGEVEPEVDLEEYSVTWHITPETVDGFAVTNIPALVTTSMFNAKEGLSREELLVVMLHHLGLKADASPLEVKAEMLKLKRFTAAGETASDAEADTLKTDDVTPADHGGAGGEPVAAEPPAEPPADPAINELALARTELAAARQRIADLEVENGAAFVKSLLHSGKLTPAQRKAAEEQAKTPAGLAQLRALYEHAPVILAGGTAPHVTAAAPVAAPHGLLNLSFALAQQGKQPHEIAEQIKRNKESR